MADMVPEFAILLIPEIRAKLQQEIDRHIAYTRASKLSGITIIYEVTRCSHILDMEGES